MYKVFLLDKGNKYAILDLEKDTKEERYHISNPVFSYKINEAGTFSFSIAANNPNAKIINPLLSRIELYRNSSKVFSGRITDVESDFFGNKKITATGGLCYLSDSVLTPQKYTKVTPSDFLKNIISKHNIFCNLNDFISDGYQRWAFFEVGTVSVPGTLTCITGWESTLESISKNLIDNFGGYVKVTQIEKNDVKLHYRIDYLAHKDASEENVSSWIEVGKNLIDLSKNMKLSDICTAVVPLGKSTGTGSELDDSLTIKSAGEYYTYNKNLVKKYGWIFRTVNFSDIESVHSLKSEGQKFIDQYQYGNAVFELTAIDNGYTNGKYMHIGDVIGIKSIVDNCVAINALTAYKINLIDPSKNTYTVGYEDKNISAQLATYINKNKMFKPGVS